MSPPPLETAVARHGPPGVFSCVVDSDRRFHLEVLRWFGALTRAAGVDEVDLVVHTVAGCSSEILDDLAAKGVAVRRVEPFDSRSPHCNKIAGALNLASGATDGLVVLTDTDVMVLEDPRSIDVPPRSVAAKRVDRPNPPLRVLEGVFAAAELPPLPVVRLAWRPDELTFEGHSNGGVYLIPSSLLPAISHAWAHWASWLLERMELLDRWEIFVDQVAMTMAIAATGVHVQPLDVRWNFPTHVPELIPADAPAPRVIHYHRSVDAVGRLRATGNPQVDDRIQDANRIVEELWREIFPMPRSGSGDAARTRNSGPAWDAAPH